jgi:hypothetical protein
MHEAPEVMSDDPEGARLWIVERNPDIRQLRIVLPRPAALQTDLRDAKACCAR